MKPLRIFISSVQKEFAEERMALRDYLLGDALLRRFFECFLFEEVPAADRRADEVYLDEVERCDIYLGLFGNDYGYEDGEGVSPTQREFEEATKFHKHRLIFVKGADDSQRHPSFQPRCRNLGCDQVACYAPRYASAQGIAGDRREGAAWRRAAAAPARQGGSHLPGS